MSETRPGRGPRTRDLRIVNAVSETLNHATDVQEALMRMLALVAERLQLRTGWVWLLDVDTGEFYNAAALNLPPYLQEPVRMTGHSCWCIDRFREGKLTPKNIDVMQCSRLSAAAGTGDSEATQGLRYHASVPLYFQDQPLGIINVTGPSWRALTTDELRLLSTIAYQVGIAVERARLAQESTRLARVEERARIAREIHDTLAQGLTAIALHIEAALPHLEIDPDRARERLQRALAMARESLEEARRSVQGLRAAPLAGKPLAEALGALGRAFTAETGIRVRLRLTGNRDLPLPVEAELFRIAQEALANVRRHARAGEVAIALRTETDRVHLVIHDNGGGFDPRTAANGGQGIAGMKERAKLLGGKLTVTGRAGRGTTIAAIAPLPPGTPA